MKKIIASLVAAAAVALPALSDPKLEHGYNSYDAMGCMLLQECTDGVDEVFSLLDISNEYDNWEDFTFVSAEFNHMLVSLNQVGVKVFLADPKYFPPGHRGVYHTVGNNFFLNRDYMGSPAALMQVMRHEGWHAAQDCMAGTIENSMIAIIKPEESVPMLWRTLAERTYPKAALPWEAEASWAGRTEGMTQEALQACAAGNMWEVYPPTPMTGEWLRENNYID